MNRTLALRLCTGVAAFAVAGFSLHGCLSPADMPALFCSAAALTASPAAWLQACLPSPTPLEVSAAASPAPIATAAPSASASPVPEATPSPTPAATRPEGWGDILPQTYRQAEGTGAVSLSAGSIKNATDLSDEEVLSCATSGLPFSIQANSSEPQVLIMHTHATETYNLDGSDYFNPEWGARTTDTSQNMCAVGQRIADALNAAGINTLHDCTLHDYPSYTGSYASSNATVQSYLSQYPSIKVVLDVHRDAIEKEGCRVKPVTLLDGENVAQVMIICGCDNNGNLPNFRQNLAFAGAWEARMEAMYPGLTRPVLFDYRYYNQDLTTGSLLIEVGGHGNTLDEALRAGTLVGQALAAALLDG